jgi:hypothetical protein
MNIEMFIELTIKKLYNIKPANLLLVDFDGNSQHSEIHSLKEYLHKTKPTNAMFIITTDKSNFPTFNIRLLHNDYVKHIFLYNHKKVFYNNGYSISIKNASEIFYDSFQKYKLVDQSINLFMSTWYIDAV